MKAAYIDHRLDISFAEELKENGIDLAYADTLNEFKMKGYSLEDFPVLLFHPGIDYQYEIGQVWKEHSNLSLAIVVPPTSQKDYVHPKKRELLIFSYEDFDKIINFIRKNQ